MGEFVWEICWGDCVRKMCMGDYMGDCMLYGRNLYGRLCGRCDYKSHTMIFHANFAANTSTSTSTTSRSPTTYTVAHQSMTKHLDHSDLTKHHQQSAQLTSRQHRRPQFHHQILTIRATIRQKVGQKVNHRSHPPHLFQLPVDVNLAYELDDLEVLENGTFTYRKEPIHVRQIKSTPHSSAFVYECAAPDRREKSRSVPPSRWVSALNGMILRSHRSGLLYNDRTVR